MSNDTKDIQRAGADIEMQQQLKRRPVGASPEFMPLDGFFNTNVAYQSNISFNTDMAYQSDIETQQQLNRRPVGASTEFMPLDGSFNMDVVHKSI